MPRNSLHMIKHFIQHLIKCLMKCWSNISSNIWPNVGYTKKCMKNYEKSHSIKHTRSNKSSNIWSNVGRKCTPYFYRINRKIKTRTYSFSSSTNWKRKMFLLLFRDVIPIFAIAIFLRFAFYFKCSTVVQRTFMLELRINDISRYHCYVYMCLFVDS